MVGQTYFEDGRKVNSKIITQPVYQHRALQTDFLLHI